MGGTEEVVDLRGGGGCLRSMWLVEDVDDGFATMAAGWLCRQPMARVVVYQSKGVWNRYPRRGTSLG